MGNAWSKHVGEWYAANSGKNGINSLKDAMRSAKCKADFREKMGGPATMKTEKNDMKKGKKGTRKVRGGSSLTPANFASEPVQTGKVDTPIKGGKKGSSLKNVLKSIESSLKKLKGGGQVEDDALDKANKKLESAKAANPIVQSNVDNAQDEVNTAQKAKDDADALSSLAGGAAGATGKTVESEVDVHVTKYNDGTYAATVASGATVAK